MDIQIIRDPDGEMDWRRVSYVSPYIDEDLAHSGPWNPIEDFDEDHARTKHRYGPEGNPPTLRGVKPAENN